ncbi:nucleoside-triphosphatase [Geovibrio sp. ADMFC3]
MSLTDSSDTKWRKGAIAGGVWGTSEMTLGSFLHNLRIPFKGHILTAIGIAILSAFGMKWRTSGMFYRAGLTSAMLKAFSPSPKVVVPMVAITIEGFLFELGTRILGRNVIGFLVSGGLAMQWAVLHKVIRLLILYGASIYTVYEQLFEKAATGLELPFINPVYGIVFVFALSFVVGAGASAVGCAAAAKSNGSDEPITFGTKGAAPAGSMMQGCAGRHSLLWLLLHIAVIAVVVGFMDKSEWLAYILLVYSLAVSVRYRNFLKRFASWKIWLPIFVISFVSGFVLKSPEGKFISTPGFLEGIRLAVRAFVTTCALSGLVSEMGHPLIAGFFRRRYGDRIDSVLSVAWGTVNTVAPSVKVRTLIKNPVKGIAGMMDSVLSSDRKRAILITGEVNGGKTTFLKAFLSTLPSDAEVRGFVAEAVFEDGTKTGYSITDVRTGESAELCRRTKDGFYFEPAGLAFGEKCMGEAPYKNMYAVFDEVGHYEMRGGGWDTLIKKVTTGGAAPVIAVRRSLVDKVCGRYGLVNAEIYDVDNIKVQAVEPAV